MINDCKMHLLNLNPNDALSSFIIHQLIGADAKFTTEMAAYRRNIVRLAEKSAREYLDVRALVLKSIEEQKRSEIEMSRDGRFIYAHLISDRLEDCLFTVRRLFRYLKRIKSHKSGFPLDRTFRRSMGSLENTITAVRDLVEHLDEAVDKGRITASAPTAPILNEDAPDTLFPDHREGCFGLMRRSRALSKAV